jgi:hypothetical protein
VAIVGSYFQSFFVKYYKALCTMCNVTNSYATGSIATGLGNTGHSSFLLIALGDFAGPISITSNSVINVTYNPAGSAFTVDVNGNLNVAGTPPLSFTTGVTAGQ